MFKQMLQENRQQEIGKVVRKKGSPDPRRHQRDLEEGLEKF